MSKIEKSWKDFLLSSGIPLEHSIKKILYDLDLDFPSEYHYLRANEQNISTDFSIDISVNQRIDLNKNSYSDYSMVYYLFECKYRYPETKWVFMPENSHFTEMNTLLYCNYQQRYSNDTDKLCEYFDKYKRVNKGIEILPKEKNSKSIEQAMQQLSYAFIHKHWEHIGDEFCFNINIPFCIVPIIVTTAELWRIKDNTTIEEIKNSDDTMGNIAEKCDFFLYQGETDNLMQKYFFDQYNKLPEKQKEIFRNNIETRYPGATFKETMWAKSIYCPDTILIISYEQFKNEFTNIKNIFTNKKFIEENI